MQIIARGQNKYLLKQYLGLDPKTGKRKFATKMFTGTFQQATKEGTKWQFQKDQGTFSAPTKLTVSELMTTWLKGKVSLSSKTRLGYSDLLAKHIVPLVGTCRVDALSRAHVQMIVATMSARGLSRRTIQYTVGVLNGCLQQAVNDNLLGKNPCNGVELPKAVHSERKVLDQVAIQTLLAHPCKHQALWAVLLTTGLRPNEALALEWKDLDLVAGNLSVNRALIETSPGKRTIGDTKTSGSVRHVPIPQTTVEALRSHKTLQARQILTQGPRYARQDIVFAGQTGRHLDYTAVVNQWKKDCAAAKVPAVRLYDTRHSHATLLLAGGVHMKVVSERLGHTNINITMDTYSHVLPGMQRDASDTVERLLCSK